MDKTNHTMLFNACICSSKCAQKSLDVKCLSQTLPFLILIGSFFHALNIEMMPFLLIISQ
uniref:Uncharacterized protein n=1 Tax=Lepeophtheirus salmonis TaxID=72036 RepID=A0A0K2SYP9_LEPSM